ncbi:hypothetical protein CAter282_2859 [Collimonas arenae]|uniref:Uncharacterized protein n=1 Tax=Collimonas arenae TaxID=279058 RepID=A0A127QKN6_9BURK|nr:hypothetical protein CAter10_3150 [Collimonas arenae]AMP10583.1 hypothetical protein CAter282_2859 [Collimonas arenae]
MIFDDQPHATPATPQRMQSSRHTTGASAPHAKREGKWSRPVD